MVENIVDPYCWDEHRKILTPAQTGIPALRTFGLCSNNRAGQPLHPHIHRGCIEIVFLMKGFQVYEAGQAHFNLSGGDLFVAYPDEPHSSGSYPESVCDLIWIQLDVTPGLPFLGLDEVHADGLRAALCCLPRIFTGDAALRASLTEAFFSLAQEDALEKSYGEQLLVCALLRMKKLSQKLFARHADSIGEAIAYIHDNLTENISLQQAADCCGLSLSRFKTKFKEETGTTPRDYIHHVKLERAKRLLEQGCSVTRVALELGFSTPNYFSTVFKKYHGLTPSEYQAAVERKKIDAPS